MRLLNSGLLQSSPVYRLFFRGAGVRFWLRAQRPTSCSMSACRRSRLLIGRYVGSERVTQPPSSRSNRKGLGFAAAVRIAI